MVLFWKREKEARDMLGDYFIAADGAYDAFEHALDLYLSGADRDAFRAADVEVHRAESKADDLRRNVEKTLYGRALLPESRGDLLGLIEAFDRLPNLTESITGMIDTQRLVFPPDLHEPLRLLVRSNIEAYRLVRGQVDKLFTDPDAVADRVEEVDKKESEADGHERALIRTIFDSPDIEPATRILLREVVQEIGEIANCAEAVSRRLEIISLKRRI